MKTRPLPPTATNRLLAILAVTMAMEGIAATLPIWREAEQFSSTTVEAGRAVSKKPPASRGISTAGVAFIAAGNAISYDFSNDRLIPEAKLVLRFARLHFRDVMQPVQLTAMVENGGHRSDVQVTCGNTFGWGTNDAKEWRWIEAPLGIDLKPGPITLRFSVSADNSNVNLDGCFLASKDFQISDAETHDLQRIQISEEGYIGMRIPGDTVFPGAFDSFSIVGRGFGDTAMKLQLSLESTDGRIHPLSESFRLPLDAEPQSIKFDASIFGTFPDGTYTLMVSKPGQDALLSHPVTIMRDLAERAREKAQEYHAAANAFRSAAGTRSRVHPAQWKLIPDLDHAAEFIENVIYVLEARQRGEATTSERAAALAYFEKSRARTAQDFTRDLEGIIAQTDQSLRLAAGGSAPYAHRTGDLRRAFYSKATGSLEPYRVFVPEAYENVPSIPLILMLHGGGGDENYFPDLDGGAILDILEERPYLMLSPKSTSWFHGPGAADLKQLIESTLEQYPKADPNRIYCTGVSAGGSGTYNMAMTYPGLFRAIACVSSGPRITDEVARLGSLPILILQGADDVVVPPYRARAAAAELEKRGHPHRLEVLSGYGHEYHGVEYLTATLDYFESNRQ